MAVRCQAIGAEFGGRCDTWGRDEAKRVYLRVGDIMVPSRLCEIHERDTNGGHLRSCTFNNYAKGDVCNCGKDKLKEINT